MTHDARPKVSRRHLVRALLGREVPAGEPGPAAADAKASVAATADAAYAAGDYPAAVAAFRTLVRDDLSNTALRVRLGHALYALGQFVQARVEFEHVLRLTEGQDRLARLGLGLTFLALGKRERAAAALAAFADPERPELVDAAAGAAKALEADGDTDLAALRLDLEALARATALLPETASA